MAHPDGSDRDARSTPAASLRTEIINGNNLFRSVSVALNLQAAARVLMAELLHREDSMPETVTLEEIVRLLPEIEILVRKLLPPNEATQRMQDVHRFLLTITPDR